MTREEKVLKQLEEHKILVMADHGWDASTIEALNYVIAMLKAEPCEDCISRQAVYEIADTFTDGTVRICMRDSVSELPPVQPIRPEAKWIPETFFHDVYYCSKCGNRIQVDTVKELPNFCNICKREMEVGE